MNSPNEKLWFNQQLMYFKDLVFNSNGVLDITLSNNTNDFKNFSPLGLNLSVTSSSNNRKMYSISYPNSIDLLSSFKEIMNNADSIFNSSQRYEIIKKYYSNRILKFEFIKDINTNQNIVIISIINDSSDYSRVIVSYFTFLSIIGILRTFANDFTNLNINFINRITLTEILDQNKLIKNSIQVLPSTILEFHNNSSNIEIIKTLEKEDINELDSTIQMGVVNSEIGGNEKIKTTLDEFDDFLNKNIDNIDLHLDIEEEKKNSNISNMSKFINDFESLENLENLMNSIAVSDNPCLTLNSELKSIGFENLLENITKDDYKSYLYLSNFTYRIILRQYIDKGIEIPQNFQALKYKNENPSVENLELAYDLLAIFSYLRLFRLKLQERESDAFKNKSIFVLAFRNFLDIYSFSNIEYMNKSSIKNIILTKFRDIKKFGFFNSFNEILDLYNLPQITESEISPFLDLLSEKIIGNGKFIDSFHEELYENNICRLNYKNDFEIEQIIDYIIPLEVSEKLEIDISNKEELEKFIDPSKIPETVKKLFNTKQKKVKEKKESVKESNILRYCKFHNDKISNSIKEEFLNELSKIENNDFDFKNTKFSFEDFHEYILIALYEWNNSTKSENYAKFNELIESSIMNKDLIISKYKTSINLENKIDFDLIIDFEKG